jgi:transposase
MAVKDKYVVRLTPTERAELEAVAKKGVVAAAKILHSRILLKTDANGPAWCDTEISNALDVTTSTISRIRQLFVEEGMERALERKKPAGRQYRKLDGVGEARLVAVACSEPPEGRTRWTLQLLADRLVELKIVESISDDTVRNTLKKMILSRTLKSTGFYLPKRTHRL